MKSSPSSVKSPDLRESFQNVSARLHEGILAGLGFPHGRLRTKHLGEQHVERSAAFACARHERHALAEARKNQQEDVLPHGGNRQAFPQPYREGRSQSPSLSHRGSGCSIGNDTARFAHPTVLRKLVLGKPCGRQGICSTSPRFYALYCLSLHCGCGQVVRQKLPKLSFAGSSPVSRSIQMLEAGVYPALLFQETLIDFVTMGVHDSTGKTRGCLPRSASELSFRVFVFPAIAACSRHNNFDQRFPCFRSCRLQERR